MKSREKKCVLLYLEGKPGNQLNLPAKRALLEQEQPPLPRLAQMCIKINRFFKSILALLPHGGFKFRHSCSRSFIQCLNCQSGSWKKGKKNARKGL